MRRFVLLDRDGTLIREKNYLSQPAQVELVDGVVDGLRRLCHMGLGLVLVTNQSGIGRGYFDRDQLARVHERMVAMLAEEGVELDGMYFCPHLPDANCHCRKPATGLVEQAVAALQFDPRESFVVGDKACDVQLGKNVGATTFLVRTGYGAQFEEDGEINPDYCVDHAGQVANIVAKLI